jgi:hypothetical protein
MAATALARTTMRADAVPKTSPGAEAYGVRSDADDARDMTAPHSRLGFYDEIYATLRPNQVAGAIRDPTSSFLRDPQSLHDAVKPPEQAIQGRLTV